jgi:hypothetical protein
VKKRFSEQIIGFLKEAEAGVQARQKTSKSAGSARVGAVDASEGSDEASRDVC